MLATIDMQKYFPSQIIFPDPSVKKKKELQKLILLNYLHIMFLE